MGPPRKSNTQRQGAASRTCCVATATCSSTTAKSKIRAPRPPKTRLFRSRARPPALSTRERRAPRPRRRFERRSMTARRNSPKTGGSRAASIAAETNQSPRPRGNGAGAPPAAAAPETTSRLSLSLSFGVFFVFRTQKCENACAHTPPRTRARAGVRFGVGTCVSGRRWGPTPRVVRYSQYVPELTWRKSFVPVLARAVNARSPSPSPGEARPPTRMESRLPSADDEFFDSL